MQIPNNVTDLLMDDCVRKHAVENAVRGCFLSCGYREVSPAGLEFYDTFAQGVGAHSQQEMVKTFDSQGRILVISRLRALPAANSHRKRCRCGCAIWVRPMRILRSRVPASAPSSRRAV